VSGIEAAVAGNPRARAHLAEIIVRFRELGIVLALLIVIAGTSIDNSRFLSSTSLQQLLSGAAIVALLAIGETLVIVTRNVDLSIGSVLGLSAYAVGAIYVHFPHVDLLLVILAGAGIGLACGIVNGAIVTLCRVPSLVVTLGTLYVIRGLDASWAGGNQINSSSLPDTFNQLGYGKVLGVPYLGIITIVCVIIATYGMRTFRSGRDLYAIGSNPEAARLAGIPVDLRVFATFAVSGAIAGFAGVLRLRRLDGGHRLRVRGRRRGRGRRRRDLRGERQRPGRSARRTAAQHDRELARGDQHLVLLGPGDPGRPADRRDRVRPPDQPAPRPGAPDTEEHP
jgi:rhamnose transport system permease protein